MARRRSETIGDLGRAPARTTSQGTQPLPKTQQTQPLPPTPRTPERKDDDGNFLWRFIRAALFENVGLKFLSLVLAVTVFLLVNTDKDREITVRIPIDYVHPADKVLVGQPPDELRVTVKGAWRILKRFDERTIDHVRVDMAAYPDGNVPIEASMIEDVPPGLDIISMNPREIHVSYDKRIAKIVEIVPTVTDRPEHGYVVAESKVAPTTVTVRGGELQLAALSSLRTTDVSVANHAADFNTKAKLVQPPGTTLDTNEVTVHVRIVEELATRKVTLPIALSVDETTKWKVEPPSIEVTFTGAVLAIDKAQQAKPRVKLVAGDQPVVVEGVPPGVGIRISPERVKVTPLK